MASQIDIGQELAGVTLFADLSPAQLDNVGQAFEEQWFQPGERAQRQGFVVPPHARRRRANGAEQVRARPQRGHAVPDSEKIAIELKRARYGFEEPNRLDTSFEDGAGRCSFAREAPGNNRHAPDRVTHPCVPGAVPQA